MFTQTAASRCGLALGLLLACWAIFAAVPAPITIDDVSYQLMARDWSAGRGLTIWNGYEERPSAELQLIVPGNASQIAAHGGRLVSQYPQPYAVLAAPLYEIFGFVGLFWLNGLAGGVALWLCGALATRLGARPFEAVFAVAVLGYSTFFADYMVGVPPHPLVSALTLGAWIGFERALEAGDRWRWPLASGLLLGLAVGVRLDAVLFAPALALLWAIDPRGRVTQLGMFTLGLAPMMATLSWTNHLKFNTFSPLSYGNQISHTSGVGAYLPALAIALPVALGLVVVARPELRRRLGARSVTLAGVAVVGLILLSPALREAASALARGSYALWADLRESPASGIEPTDTLSASGAMYHWGSIKKALAQSIPWLGLTPLWALSALGSGPSASTKRRLMLLPGALTALYGLRAYHGGGSLNLRYFVPALPFLAIAVALTVGELTRELGRRQRALAGIAGLAALLTPLLLAPDPWMPAALTERFYLDLPLALAGCAMIGSLAWGALRATARPSGGMAALTLALTAAGLGWATGVTWGYDVPRRLETRERNLAFGAAIQAELPEGGIVFGALAEHIGLAAELPDTRISLPTIDQGADMAALLHANLEAGNRCLGLFSRHNWDLISARHLAGDVQTRTLWVGESFELKQFTSPTPPTP